MRVQAINRKFRSGCLMLMRQQGEQLHFLGSAFLVHADGYLLTAAHLVANPEGLMVVPSSFTDDFVPMSFERVAAIGVQVMRTDNESDVALLRLNGDISISVPDDFLGGTDKVYPGTEVVSLGYSFGHEQLHTVITYSGIVAGKIRSPNKTALILFDKMVYDGDRGGPLVHAADGHVVGIVNGRFEPSEIVRTGNDWERPPTHTSLSYAVAIEYGLTLMAEAGLRSASRLLDLDTAK